jgi:glycosyltransferase involved in cell wall biosynthesis
VGKPLKKKLLFVMNNLNCGGAEKALVSLLQTIDYSRYEVDLYLFRHEGMFLASLPEQVKLLDAPPLYRYFDMSVKAAVADCLQQRRYRLALSRLRAGYIFRTEKNRARCEQRVWKHLSQALGPLPKRYDAAIGFLEKNPVYFSIEKVNAARKLGFIHNDYDKLEMDALLDQPYFARLDYLVTVSDQCGAVLERRFPQYREKVKVMHNIVSPTMIHAMSLSQQRDVIPAPANPALPVTTIVSLGRLVRQKGFDLAVEACKLLVDKGYPVQWLVIGEGEERGELEGMISQYGLGDTFKLLGLRDNPYPYIRNADIYVQPSRFEGKSIAIDEAKILHKPIVVTNFSTAQDQIGHLHNGLIVDMQAEAIAAGIMQLIEDSALRVRLAQRLSEEQLGTEQEIDKLYALV